MYKCTKGFVLGKTDDHGFVSEDDSMIVLEGSIWDIPEEEDYRLIGGEIRLEDDDGNWIEISEDDLKEHFVILGEGTE